MQINLKHLDDKNKYPKIKNQTNQSSLIHPSRLKGTKLFNNQHDYVIQYWNKYYILGLSQYLAYEHCEHETNAHLAH